MSLLDRAKRALGFSSLATVAAATHEATDSFAANALAAAPRWSGGTGVLTNLMSGLNTTEDQSWWDVWYRRRPLTDIQRMALGADPLVRRMLSMLGDDSLAEAWTSKIKNHDALANPQVSAAIRAYEQREGIDIDNQLRDASRRAFQFSSALVLLGIDDGRPPDQPVDTANIKRIWWTGVVDRRDFQYESVIDPRGRVSSLGDTSLAMSNDYAAGADRFGQVETYLITDLNGVLPDGIRYGDGLEHAPVSAALPITQYRFHSDRVLFIQHDDAQPMTDRIQDAVAAYFRGMSGISRAIDRSSLFVWKVANHVAQSFSENSHIGSKRLRDAMRQWASHSAMVIDKVDEDFAPAGTGSTSGLGDAIHPIMLWICAVCGIPATRLFGMSPGGFGKGDAEQNQWYDRCRSWQRYLTPAIRKFDRYVVAAQDGGIGVVIASGDISVEWPDLEPATEKDKADIFAAKAEAVAKLVERGILLETEAISAFPEIALDTTERQRRNARGQSVGAMPVGVFTGLLELLVTGGALPPDVKRALAMTADPERITADVAARLFPDTPVAAPTPGGGLPGALPPGSAPAATLDASQAAPAKPVEPPRPIPADVTEAAILAAEYGIPSRRLSRMVERGELRNYDVAGNRPVYSRAEFLDVLRKRNLSPEDRDTEEWEEIEALDDFDTAALIEALSALPEDAQSGKVDQAGDAFASVVNMKPADLRKHAKTPWASRGIGDDGSIARVIDLLESKTWTVEQAAEAMRVVHFITAASKIKPGPPLVIDSIEGPSKRDAMLANWGSLPDLAA